MDGFAGRHPHLAHLTGKRRRDRGHRLVGFHFEQGVAFRNPVARFDENLHDFPFVDAFAQIGQLEFNGHGRFSYPSLRSLRAAFSTRSAWGR